MMPELGDEYIDCGLVVNTFKCLESVGEVSWGAVATVIALVSLVVIIRLIGVSPTRRKTGNRK